MKITGFLHVAQIGDWKKILAEQLSLVNRCGLADRCHRIFLGILGGEKIKLHSPFEVMYQRTDLSLYEYETLRMLREYSKTDEGLLWYAHTKGASKTQHEWDKNQDYYKTRWGIESLEVLVRHEREWRYYMQHFVFKKHTQCIEALNDHDVAGPSWRDDDFPHFSGNFWWARSSYVRKLRSPYALRRQYQWIDDRVGAEAWIGSHSPRVKCLCGLSHNFYRWGVPIKDYLPIYL